VWVLVPVSVSVSVNMSVRVRVCEREYMNEYLLPGASTHPRRLDKYVRVFVAVCIHHACSDTHTQILRTITNFAHHSYICI